MKKGWYILNYHDVSWEEGSYLRGVGGNGDFGNSCPPDVFREHLACLSRHGEFVSVQEGFERYQSGDIKGPLISFWFDDGFVGVRKYAYSLLEKYNVKAAVSVNSKFMLKEEMFWRLKLSFLSQVDGLRFLRSRLRKYGYKNRMLICDFTLHEFSLSILDEIDAVYKIFTNELHRKDAFRVFDDVKGIKWLRDNGWLIANHSASHYPVGEDSCIGMFSDEYNECEKVLNNTLGVKTKFWVLPFDRPSYRSEKLKEVFGSNDKEGRGLVLVGEKINKEYNEKGKFLYRIHLPIIGGKEIIDYLGTICYPDS